MKKKLIWILATILAVFVLACEEDPKLNPGREDSPAQTVSWDLKLACDSVQAKKALARVPDGMPANIEAMLQEYIANTDEGRDNTNQRARIIVACRNRGWTP